MRANSLLAGFVIVSTLASMGIARVHIEFVTVGDPCNMPDPNYAWGQVDYVYSMGKYELTNGQYIEFLNAVARTDPNGLYNPDMGGELGGIERTGSPGSYSYGPKGGDAAWLNRPVNFLDWFDCLRFCNWMHNGQPWGDQDPNTTEDGVYDLSLGINAVRKEEASFFVPTMDEWYKAAYYKGGSTTADYWEYATRSDQQPAMRHPRDDNGNSANYHIYGYPHIIGPPYWTGEVGAYSLSHGPYGTLNQNGNIYEWTETVRFTSSPHQPYSRGGGWFGFAQHLPRSAYEVRVPSSTNGEVGLRLAAVSGDPYRPLFLLGPNGGEYLRAGESYAIRWHGVADITQVMLEYSTDNGLQWTSIVASTENDGHYEWPIPPVNSKLCRVRVSNANELTCYDASRAVFTIDPCEMKLWADLDYDCYVNLIDMALLAQEWLDCTNPFDPNCSIP